MTKPLLQSLVCKLKLVYIDDVTLGGSESQVAECAEEIRRMGRDIGVQLNAIKCEFISRCTVSTNTVFAVSKHLSVELTELLGAPLTVGTAMDTALSCRCDDLARAATRLRSIAAYDALVLFKASFIAPTLMHTMRAAPCSRHAALQEFDELLRECVCTIPTPISLMSNGFKPVCLSKMLAWEYDVSHHSHLQHFWPYSYGHT
jgi:hypothetical protein